MPLYPQTTVPQTPFYGSQQYAPTVQYPQIQPTYPPYATVPAIVQTPSPTQKTTGIFGRFVNSASEITPNEISMDGSYSIFPLNDMSKILVKSWNTDGTISTLEFSPVGKSEKVDIKDEDDRISMILDKLSKLEEQLG